MTIPPKMPEHRFATQSELRELFIKHDFDGKLAVCEQEPICPKRPRKPEDTFHSSVTEYEEGVKYRDRVSKQTAAVLFWYTDISGAVTTIIRSLRVGDIVYDAYPRPR